MGMFTNLFYNNNNPYKLKTRSYRIELEFNSQDTNTYFMSVNKSDIPEAAGPTAVKSMVLNFNALSVTEFVAKYGRPISVKWIPLEYWNSPSNTANLSLSTGTFAVNTTGDHSFQWAGPTNLFTTVKKLCLFIECEK